MSTEEDLFEAASALPDAERPAFLDNACAGQPALRKRIESLLRSHETTGFMVARPGIQADGTALSGQSGDRIGRYRLLQQIGEGGFGVVWMAEQLEPVTRRVALKIIKAGMDTKEVIARFAAERQALAMMDHPNIARVFDAGATEQGRPYFVMELVKGIPITKFCDEQEFSTRRRLELFADVCSAINHAHQKGVIHRDLKPSNVMVTLNGDRPIVKVIDFGIAKATRGRLTDRTLFTRFEQFLGTPAYMSPEQAAISELDIDTRSDIYGLGILLYELLTGAPPFDAKSLLSAGYEEMRRIIREVDPPKPSSRLGNVVGDQRTVLARARHIGPEKLRRSIRADLDWIVMKAIEKDRARRYDTANGLALDVQRFLAGEPVTAGSPSVRYRAWKVLKKHRGAVAAILSVVVALIAGLVASVAIYVRTKATAQAEAQIRKAEAKSATTMRAIREILNGRVADRGGPDPGGPIGKLSLLNNVLNDLEAGARAAGQNGVPADTDTGVPLSFLLRWASNLSARGETSGAAAKLIEAAKLADELSARTPDDIAAWTLCLYVRCRLAELLTDFNTLDEAIGVLDATGNAAESNPE